MDMKEKMPISSTTPVPTPSAAIAAEAREREEQPLPPEPAPVRVEVAPQPNADDTAEDASGREPKMCADRVSVFYGEKQAIKDVSIRIYEDRVTAFIGPSGCGKSTFLR